MIMNSGRNSSVSNILSNLDELESINPELAAIIKMQDEEHLRLLNDALKEMSAEEIVHRLKGVLWRITPYLRLSETVPLDYGGEVLSVSLRESLMAITDAIKWIGWNNDLDPLEAFGDDTMVIAVRDVVVGKELTRSKHVNVPLDENRRLGDNDTDDPDV